jgi:hypothetical protein
MDTHAVVALYPMLLQQGLSGPHVCQRCTGSGYHAAQVLTVVDYAVHPYHTGKGLLYHCTAQSNRLLYICAECAQMYCRVNSSHRLFHPWSAPPWWSATLASHLYAILRPHFPKQYQHLLTLMDRIPWWWHHTHTEVFSSSEYMPFISPTPPHTKTLPQARQQPPLTCHAGDKGRGTGSSIITSASASTTSTSVVLALRLHSAALALLLHSATLLLRLLNCPQP